MFMYVLLVMGLLWFAIAIYANSQIMPDWDDKAIVVWLYATAFCFFIAAFKLSPYILVLE